jgi:hypothetical protein
MLESGMPVLVEDAAEAVPSVDSTAGFAGVSEA